VQVDNQRIIPRSAYSTAPLICEIMQARGMHYCRQYLTVRRLPDYGPFQTASAQWHLSHVMQYLEVLICDTDMLADSFYV
jgi:hypothetical protein